MARVLKPGGRLLVLEFFQGREPAGKSPTTGTRSTCCRASASGSPATPTSYRYLAESIRMHPDQATLKAMMKDAGFGHVDVHRPGRWRGGAARGHRC
jgi:demethylmenaquinone methyltransferase/2-methoxy-6-polyprenyl-1,4-benzoquinol methylase